MISKFMNKVKSDTYKTVLSVSVQKNYDINEPYKETAVGVPKAPANPYRKRPLKLQYDKNEYYMFRLPSENQFLLGSFDS